MDTDNKRIIDWDSIEKAYIAGVVSTRAIAKKFGVDEKWIRVRAKDFLWVRDLDGKIKHRVDAIVRSQTHISPELRFMPRSRESEREIIESVAATQSAVIIEESALIKRLMRICATLESQLEVAIYNAEGNGELERNSRIAKTLIENRDKVFNMRRRNAGISDNANGNANTPKPTERDSEELIAEATIIASRLKM